ncbi:Phage integrase family protein [Chishuiella changwenlii]|uniref:Phage integrase family protein n=1 Tax=Chishuiella changwenlii TaxID=1434701 RepID=A0A1M6UW87_9FLAO|nr:tyrosine-type recombinase/integrase [Chishuiella changwenlii]GGF11466.1 hypothetical protein GCM10010984_30620 [Chishuiella changwenlii]SHK73474.1 Phage integrase family protein [Chishuiella changwenlii]
MTNLYLDTSKSVVKNRFFKELKADTKINFYTAGHSFATLSLRNGVQVSKIKQALGHQSIKTTESYLEDFKDHEIDEAFEKLF